MKNYELTYLIKPDLLDEQAKEVQDKITSFIRDKEGILLEEVPAARKKLAYSVRKTAREEWSQQAYLATAVFQSKPELLPDLEINLKANENVLRYLLITKKPRSARDEARRTRVRPAVKTAEGDISEQALQKKKVDLKEIDQKIEEILGQ